MNLSQRRRKWNAAMTMADSAERLGTAVEANIRLISPLSGPERELQERVLRLAIILADVAEALGTDIADSMV